ncbi:VanW family protein [Lentibacillus sp. N15]|uniref:VanW family protein n=1 Tax=Lentibacillus songyuanensis TaxID=3136161 RepID=UPI0031BA1307
MKSLTLSFLLVMVPMAAIPNELAITDHDKVLTTVTRDHFTIPFMDGPFIDKKKLELLVDNLEEKVYQKPVDAQIDDQGQIIAERPGYALDKDKFLEQFQSFVYEGKPTKVKVLKRPVHPRVDSELLATIREKKIGSYSTRFRQSNKERSNNIQLAAEAINNYVLFPNETFSFNKVVGKRTKEKGYMRAPVIVKGELAEDIGGGICQVSSTLYNAVDLAGIEIVERYSHSRSVPYVPPGRDATVSWYGPDFVFTNKAHQPILIRAKASHGNMMINVYSADTPNQ